MSKSINNLDSFILELDNHYEMDELLNKAFFKARKLDIFKGEAIDFYIGISSSVENCILFNDKFNRLEIFIEEIYTSDSFNSSSYEDREKIERKMISLLSRLEKQKIYSNLALLFQYSLVIEAVINRDQVMKDHPERKDQYLSLGFSYKNTTSTWIELVSYASNFSRHNSEWRFILYEVFKGQSDKEILINSLVSDKYKRKNILKLFEFSLNNIESLSEVSIFEISNKLIKDLELLNLEKSFKRIETWLRRVELKWADQFFPSERKYLGLE